MNGAKILGIGLSARRALCIHPEVMNLDTREKVDSACRDKTAGFVRGTKKGIEDSALCEFYENLEGKDEIDGLEGIYSLEDMRSFGRKHKLCPYFVVRRMVYQANVIVCNYPYVIDTRVGQVLFNKINDGDCLVVFDEAHNIDNICVDSLTIMVNKGVINAA